MNTHARNGCTPLMASATYNMNAAITQALVEAGAHIDHADSLGTTALMRAARANRPEVVQVLIEAGSDLDAMDIVVGTPLMHAVMGHDAWTVVTMLLEAGADPSLRNKVGKTAFHIAREREALEEAADFDLQPTSIAL